MTHCIYTGAQVWFEHDCTIRPADIYQIGSDHLAIRFSTGPVEMWQAAEEADVAKKLGATHLVFRHSSHKGDWFRDDLGVHVTSRSHCQGEYRG